MNFFFFTSIFIAQNKDNYIRFIDSADAHIDESSLKALTFLDSIPKPVEGYIEGRLAEYYAMKALIHDDYNEATEVYKNYILAYKYAEKEEDFVIAGEVCLELFSSAYFAKRDTTAYAYLDKAKDYFKRGNHKNGLVDVEQMEIYIKFLDGEYEICNDLILEKIDSYKNIKDNAYYEMFASYMLISNLIYLDDFKAAHFYYNDFKKFENNSTIAKYNYYSFKSTLDVCFADVFIQNKSLDSTQYYLSKSFELREYMGGDTEEDYLGIYANFHKLSGNLEFSRAYLDSLSIFQAKMYNDVVNASFDLNEDLLFRETNLTEANNQKFFERFWIVILILILIVISVIFYIKNKKTKLHVDELGKKKHEFSNLKSSHEKLKLKVHSLEEYIGDVKKEVKVISTLGETTEQHNKIKELYNNIHLNSSTILSKEENHLELITELNIAFFERISSDYPELSNSEIIICYYLFSDFKSKEIAVFLSSSTRAIESKRYRISKKLKVKENNFTLYEFLNNKFGDLKST